MDGAKYLWSLVAALILVANVAEAAPWGRRAVRGAASAPATSLAPQDRYEPHRPLPAQTRNSQGYWSFQPELYPQWYGGFHGRMLQNYGYPPGDLGLRGMAW